MSKYVKIVPCSFKKSMSQRSIENWNVNLIKRKAQSKAMLGWKSMALNAYKFGKTNTII